MAFGKAIFAKTLDLLEDAFGEVGGDIFAATMPSIISSRNVPIVPTS